MIKKFDQFVTDKSIESVYESMMGRAVATSVVMSRRGSRRTSSSSYDDDNHSKGAKIIIAIIKMIFIAGGSILIGISSSFIGVVGLVICLVGLFGGFKDFIDTKILKNNVNESLNDEELELITEGKLKDFFKEKVLKVAMENEKVKSICEEIMKRDDFKEAQKEDSVKDLIKCVVRYFKENKKRENEFKQLQAELKEE
jgi:hypothetical protein